jgi:hypothetical protein
MRDIINIILENSQEDYRGEHGAADKISGSPLYDLTANGTYPADVYSSNGYRYYGQDAAGAFSLVMDCKGRPNKMIRIYRAIPKDIKAPINKGDWVTISKAYAKEHGEAHLNNNFRIISKQVFARDIYTDGDSLEEWGYDPQPYIQLQDEEVIRKRLGMRSKIEVRAEMAARKAAKENPEA